MAYTPIITAAVNALEGTGKTEFLKSLPTPAAVFHIDPNTEEQFEKAFDDGELDRDDFRLYPIQYPPVALMKNDSRDRIKEIAERELNQNFLDPLAEMLNERKIKSIGLDTATELYELVLLSKHGKTVQILQDLRTISNYEFKGILRAIQRSGKHSVLLHRARPFYQSKIVNTSQGKEEQRNAVDGVYEREGFSKTGFAVNIEAYLCRDTSREGLSNQFGIRVAKCTARPTLKTAEPQSKEFWDLKDEAWWFGKEKIDGEKIRRVSFQYLALQAYPNTKLDDWR